MKTIIIKNAENTSQLLRYITKLEKYTDKMIDKAVVCTRLLDVNNFHSVLGEVKDATELDDFDLFIIGDVDGKADTNAIRNVNKTKTLVVEANDYESAKNFVVML